MKLDIVELRSFEKIKFEWELNVQELNSKKKGESISSPIFGLCDYFQKIYLELYPQGDENSIEDYMGLFLQNDNDHEVTLDLTLSFLRNNVEVNVKKIKNKAIVSKNGWGWSDFIYKETVFDPNNQYLKNNQVIIVCTIFAPILNMECIKLRNLSFINNKLFTNEKYSDVTIKCRNKEFYLHKCILATYSTVFEAMFEADITKKDKIVIEIYNVDSEVVYQFFKFLYTSEVDNLKDIAVDLLFLAERYFICELKDICEQTLSKALNIENAVNYLYVANINKALKLKNIVIKFMADNITTFIDKPEFKSVSKEHMIQIMNHIKNKKFKDYSGPPTKKKTNFSLLKILGIIFILSYLIDKIPFTQSITPLTQPKSVRLFDGFF